MRSSTGTTWLRRQDETPCWWRTRRGSGSWGSRCWRPCPPAGRRITWSTRSSWSTRLPRGCRAPRGARPRTSDAAGVDTRHPHRGFDNLWYVLKGSASTGHSTGPGGAMERARLSEGALLALRTGRGAWHAEALGADELAEGNLDAEFHSVLFWVNLARKDKQVEPSA